MRALVTGATAGIGEATARRLAAEGYDLVLTGRRHERLETLAEALRGDVSVETAAFDLNDAETTEAFLASVGHVDVLVNNAGLARGTNKMQDADVADWQEMVDTNIMALLRMTRPISKQMADRGSGHIVNLGSVAGRWVYPGGGVYCATKHAVGAITEGLRMDLLGTGVRVTNIEPGLVETEFSMVRFRGDAAKAKAVYSDTVPLMPDDVADAIHWCISRPARVNVQELVLYPTDQASVRDVRRG